MQSKHSEIVSEIPLILNIETATEICSVALALGTEVLSIKASDKPNDHTRIITLLIEQVFQEAEKSMEELQAVAVSSGPGSYTSLRVGVSTAKGICFAREIPLIAVDTLQAMARAAFLQEEDEKALYCPMIDARRMEVYCALYDHKSEIIEEVAAKIIDESAFRSYFDAGQRIIFSGNGAKKCEPVLNSPYAAFTSQQCTAGDMVYFSSHQYVEKTYSNLAYFTPRYIKPPNITIPKPKSI